MTKRWFQSGNPKVLARPSPTETLFRRALAAVSQQAEPQVVYVKPRQRSAPIVTRTPAQLDALRKRKRVNRQAFIKTMTRGGVLTEAEAARQYDDEHGCW